MDLIEVNVVDAQPSQACVERVHQVIPRGAPGVGPFAQPLAAFGAQDDPVAHALERRAQQLLGQRPAVIPRAIDVGGVKIVHTLVQRGPYDLPGGHPIHSTTPLPAGSKASLRIRALPNVQAVGTPYTVLSLVGRQRATTGRYPVAFTPRRSTGAAWKAGSLVRHRADAHAIAAHRRIGMRVCRALHNLRIAP